MKNLLKSLIILVVLGAFSQSCNEKQSFQTNEFEYQNALNDNKVLLNEVNAIVNQYDENAHNLRLEIAENKNCHEIKKEFRNLSNEQKAAVWKDRIISEIKNKPFTGDDYYYLTKLFNLIDSKAYVTGSKENEKAKADILSLWKEVTQKNINYKNIMKTVFLLSDNIKWEKNTKQIDPPDETPMCDCNWGGFCTCQWITCTITPGGCGPLYYFDCIKLCGQYY